jgi:diacylglycerol kinase
VKTLDHERLRGRLRNGRFRRAFRGTKRSVRGDSNFFVYLFSTAMVVIAAAALEARLVEWALLLLCITMVLGAEMFHTAIQRLVETHDVRGALPRDACDVSQAAVLVITVGAAIVGALILASRLRILLGA